MFNKLKLFLSSIVILNVMTLPVKSQIKCPYQYYMIGPDLNCINLDSLGGQSSRQQRNVAPTNLNNNGKVEKSGETPQEKPLSPEQMELTYAIKEKQTSLEFIQKDNEKMKEQIGIVCSSKRLTSLDGRQFCLKEKERLGKNIEENQERITTLENEIKDLEKKIESAGNNQ